MIWCPVPLPEGPATDLLTRMLVPTPYQVVAFRETEVLLPKGKSAEGVLRSKKRAASEGQEGKPSKKGKMPSSSGLGRANNDEDEPHDKT